MSSRLLDAAGLRLVFHGAPAGVLVSCALVSCATFAACSSTDAPSATDGRTSVSDGGTPAVDATVSPTESTQSGRLITAQSTTPIPAAKVTIDGKSVTTDAEGRYRFVVPRGKPITMRGTAEDHFAFIDQEWILDTPTLDRGDTFLLSGQTGGLLGGFLSGYDKALGVLGVRIVPLAGCESEERATLTLEPAGASLRYSVGGIPSGQATSAAKGQTITAIFYNVAVNVPLKVTVKHPTCSPVPFPVEQSGVRYTGNQTAEPGDSLSFFRVYLAGAPGADAGTD